LKTATQNYLLNDAAEGDSGAPLYTLGRMDPSTKERTESKLVGLHTSGLPAFVFKSLRKKGIILPKWNIRVARFSKWIKCVQENAWKGLKDTTKIKQACNNAERYSLPRCDHTQLFFEGRIPWLNNDYQCCDGTDYNDLCKNYN